MAKASGGPSGDLGLGHGHDGIAVSSSHVHGGTAAHRAWWRARRADEAAVHDSSPSLMMVLGLMEMQKHALEGDDRT